MRDFFEYSGKTCVITGASSGMGKALTEVLIKMGADVYALDMNNCNVEGIHDFYKVDLSDRSEIDMAFSKLPDSIDCFFGVAGLSGTRTDYMTTFNVNYTSNMYITERYLKDRMKKGGAITYVSSMSGVAWKENLDECRYILDITTWDGVQEKMAELINKEFPTTHAYLYSKRLLCAFGCKASLEFAKKNVRVNSVLPGSADTGMKSEFEQMAGGEENLIRYAGLAGRLAKSEEVAYTMAFLGSPMASFISGDDIIVDYCDHALVKMGIKPEVCGAKAFG